MSPSPLSALLWEQTQNTKTVPAARSGLSSCRNREDKPPGACMNEQSASVARIPHPVFLNRASGRARNHLINNLTKSQQVGAGGRGWRMTNETGPTCDTALQAQSLSKQISLAACLEGQQTAAGLARQGGREANSVAGDPLLITFCPAAESRPRGC